MALNRQKLAAMDKPAGRARYAEFSARCFLNVVGRASSRAGVSVALPDRDCNPATNCFWQWLHGQRVADFETFRQVTEEGGGFPGQHAGQPMSHADQDALANACFNSVISHSRSKATLDTSPTFFRKSRIAIVSWPSMDSHVRCSLLSFRGL